MPRLAQSSVCFFCSQLLSRAAYGGFADASVFECPRCGTYALTGTAIAVIEAGQEPFTVRERALLSHLIRNHRRDVSPPLLDDARIDKLLETNRLPSAAEQAEKLILWLGESLDGAGDYAVVNDGEHGGVVGAVHEGGFRFVIDGLLKDELLEGTHLSTRESEITLSFKGWTKFEEIKRGRARGLRAFMAMKFGNEELTAVYREFLQPAARLAGFDLRKVNEEPRPGLIDARIRVEILESRFIVADLSDSNPGAYFEAGYAEGLGKPVIYLCKREVFERNPTHFDTNHSLTVLWSPQDASTAANELKSIIRATFPFEAKMTDDSNAG